MIEKLLAGATLAVCVGLLLGMWVGRERVPRLLQRARSAWRWNRQRRSAHKEAVEAIERARRAGPVPREGNVYRPTFQNRRSNDTHE